MGMVLPKAPPRAATVALLIGPVAYGLLTCALDVFFDSQAYLNAAARSLRPVEPGMVVGSLVRPLEEARPLPKSGAVDLEPAPSAEVGGRGRGDPDRGPLLVFW